MSAELLFHARIEAEVPEHNELEDLADRLETIADEMDVEVQLETAWPGFE